MKNGRIIEIKTSQMQQVRNSLRILLVYTINRKIKELINELSTLSLENSVGIKENHARQGKLSNILYSSISICPICHKSDKDMYYNAYTKEWVCVECLEVIREEFKEKAALYEQGQHYGDYDFMYFGSFLK